MFVCRSKHEEKQNNIIACLFGAGIIAGIVGTGVITFAQMIEMKITGRKPSDTPAQAGAKVLGVEPKSEQDKQRFNNLVHWFYGTAWGMFRVDLFFLGLVRLPATFIHFLGIWIGGMILLPQLKVSSPPWKWGWKAVLIDGLLHLIYAAGAGITFDFLIKRK